jgi:hypothetical protein
LGSISRLLFSFLGLIESEAKVFRLALIRIGLSILFLLLAWTLTLCGIGIITLALYLCLTKYLNPPVAALASGLIVLIVATAFAWIAKKFVSIRISGAKEIPWIKRSPLEVALFVLLAGFIAGASPRSREALSEGLVWLFRRDQT